MAHGKTGIRFLGHAHACTWAAPGPLMKIAPSKVGLAACITRPTQRFGAHQALVGISLLLGSKVDWTPRLIMGRMAFINSVVHIDPYHASLHSPRSLYRRTPSYTTYTPSISSTHLSHAPYITSFVGTICMHARLAARKSAASCSRLVKVNTAWYGMEGCIDKRHTGSILRYGGPNPADP